MKTIIKPSSDLRHNYNEIAQIAERSKAPVFLTKNGAEHTVLMDHQTFFQREEDLATAERLIAAKMDFLNGDTGVGLKEFKKRMQEAIKSGAAKEKHNGA